MTDQKRPQFTAGELIEFLKRVDPKTLVDVQFYAAGATHLDRFATDQIIVDDYNQRVVILAEYN